MNRPSITIRKLSIVLSACVLLYAFSTPTLAAPKGKLKVFILTGQSNMQGKGKIQHLDELIADAKNCQGL